MQKYIIVIIIILTSTKLLAQDTFFKNSSELFVKGEFNKSDFYLALHINNEVKNPQIEIPIVFDKLIERGMKPTSFIDGKYSFEFLTFFFSDTLFQWNSNIYDENSRVILTRVGKNMDNNLYVAVWGRPRMEMWSVIGEDSNNSFLLGYADADVVVGNYNSNDQPIPCNAFNLSGPFTHLYNSTFFDIDKDGFPEMFIKFNLNVADGFIQSLNIYKSKNNNDFCERSLIKEFSARNGFIKQEGNKITIGVQKRDDGEAWLGASLHEVTEIHYDGKKESIIKVETIPNVLRGSDTSYWY